MFNRKEWDRQYYKDHRERIVKRHRQWSKDNPGYTRRYGLSYEEWLKMWVCQDGDCAICGEPFAQHSDAHVDHNHDTGEIRGLLCRKCNPGLGNFNDDPKLMIKAIKYLKHFRK